VILQRYYFYIHNGIDTEHVAPMEDSWLENVLMLISGDLKVSEMNRDVVAFSFLFFSGQVFSLYINKFLLVFKL